VDEALKAADAPALEAALGEAEKVKNIHGCPMSLTSV
jgi:hypothetical protein